MENLWVCLKTTGLKGGTTGHQQMGSSVLTALKCRHRGRISNKVDNIFLFPQLKLSMWFQLCIWIGCFYSQWAPKITQWYIYPHLDRCRTSSITLRLHSSFTSSFTSVPPNTTPRGTPASAVGEKTGEKNSKLFHFLTPPRQVLLLNPEVFEAWNWVYIESLRQSSRKVKHSAKNFKHCTHQGKASAARNLLLKHCHRWWEFRNVGLEFLLNTAKSCIWTF